MKDAATTCRALPEQTVQARDRTVPSGRRLVLPLAGFGVTGRLRLALFGLLALPAGTILYLAESGRVTDTAQLVALWLALGLVLLKPASTLIARFVALGEIAGVNAFCAALRRGEYARRLPLPPQGDDEHELLVLKRDLNWMAHSFETREAWLRTRLDETHQRKRQFEALSRTDALTGLSNRRQFDADLDEQTARAWSGTARLALLLIDCDAFKTVNDRFGHPAGDAVLAAMGRTLRGCVREGVDGAYRLGGDEFALLLPNLDPDAALAVARRARTRFQTANAHGATASIGVACLDATLDRPPLPASLLGRCDAALYRVKAAGGDGERLAGPDASIENEN